MLSKLFCWICIILIPAIPVVVFYTIFTKQNYFQLTGFFKGVVGAGPIAAYIFLVWLGQNIFQKIIKIFPLLIESPSVKALIGKWEYESISAKDTIRKGVCYIKERNGAIVLNGTIEADGKKVGQWNSRMTGVLENKLMIFYDWEELEEGKQIKMEGISTVVFGDPPISEMNGNWTGVGVPDVIGRVKFTRTK